MTYFIKTQKFNAAHELFVHSWSEEKNNEVFGKFCDKHWLGRNYKLNSRVSSVSEPLTGFLMDVMTQSELIPELVLEDIDHSNIYLDKSFIYKETQPNTEVVCGPIFNQLQPFITQATLHSVIFHQEGSIYGESLG